MRKAATNRATAPDSEVTSIFSHRAGRRLSSVPDTEGTDPDKTVVCNPLDAYTPTELSEVEVGTDEAIASLIEESRRNRRELQGGIDSAINRISSLELDTERLRKSNVERRREIIAANARLEKNERYLRTHDLAFVELHRVQLPAMNCAISALQDSNRQLRHQVDSLGRELSLQRATIALANYGHHAPYAAAPARKTNLAWAYYLAGAFALSITGIGLAIGLLH